MMTLEDQWRKDGLGGLDGVLARLELYSRVLREKCGEDVSPEVVYEVFAIAERAVRCFALRADGLPPPSDADGKREMRSEPVPSSDWVLVTADRENGRSLWKNIDSGEQEWFLHAAPQGPQGEEEECRCFIPSRDDCPTPRPRDCYFSDVVPEASRHEGIKSEPSGGPQDEEFKNGLEPLTPSPQGNNEAVRKAAHWIEYLGSDSPELVNFIREAAAALEQLVKEIDGEKAIASGWHKRWKESQENIAALRAENERLKKEIVDFFMWQTARAALEPK